MRVLSFYILSLTDYIVVFGREINSNKSLFFLRHFRYSFFALKARISALASFNFSSKTILNHLSIPEIREPALNAGSLVVYMSTTYKLDLIRGGETETAERGLPHSAFASRTFIPTDSSLSTDQVVHGASASISSILRICGIPRDDLDN